MVNFSHRGKDNRTLLATQLLPRGVAGAIHSDGRPKRLGSGEMGYKQG